MPTTFRAFAAPPGPRSVTVSPVIWPTPPIFSARIWLSVFAFHRNMANSESYASTSIFFMNAPKASLEVRSMGFLFSLMETAFKYGVAEPSFPHTVPSVPWPQEVE